MSSLDIIEKTVELIRKRRNPNFDIEKIPFDDKKTYQLLWKGYVLGIYQLELLKGLRELVIKTKPSKLEDLAKLIPFASKSYSEEYAKLIYQTAYLKANYTIEFYVVLLSIEMSEITDKQKFYKKISDILNEAKQLGINILPPDINESDFEFKIENQNSIRYGLGAIEGADINVIKDILKARKLGKFRSIPDLRIRVSSLNRKTLEALIKSGACDSIFNHKSVINNNFIFKSNFV